MAAGTALLIWTVVSAVQAQRTDAFVESRDHTAIQYSNGPVEDRISALNRRLDDGSVLFAFDSVTGYLRSALGALGVSTESQVVVYSPTSSQAEIINRRNPRAVYFADDVALGWIRGGSSLEIAAEDPRQGVIFYSLDQKRAEKPRFRRNDQCLACHLSWDTQGVPGMLVFSMVPLQDRNAYATGFPTDHRSAFADRWGGWYVTGALGALRRHLGNLPLYRDEAPGGAKAGDPPPPLASLDHAFDTTGYLTRHSDVVALMVLEHQSRITNLITRVGWETRVGGGITPRVAEAVSDLVDYILFLDEMPLPGKIDGLSGFTEKFSAQGPHDRKGRSLRQLDLKTRLMRYPCSYMIYAPAFDALPGAAMDAVYKRLWQSLSGHDKQAKYTLIPLADRQAVVEILRDTKKSLPKYFQSPPI